MTSLYSQYISERFGHQILESSRGFITYSFHDTQLGLQLFVHDIYVPQEFRTTGEARRLVATVKELARDKGCTHAMAGIDVTSKTATDAMKFQISVGMKIYRNDGNMIYMFMEL